MKTLAEPKRKTSLTKSRMAMLLSSSELMPEHIAGMNEKQRYRLNAALENKLSTCETNEKSGVLEKIAIVRNDQVMNKDIWELNHNRILKVISENLSKFGQLPSQMIIAEKTGLSRQCIARHMKEPSMEDHLDQLKVLKMTLLEMVLAQAFAGDLKAAKIYMDAVDKVNDKSAPAPSPNIKQQNNYIQVNGILINEEKLGKLSPEQLSQLETILGEKSSCSSTQC